MTNLAGVKSGVERGIGTDCQGRIKTRPVGRSKSRPVEYLEGWGLSEEDGVSGGGLRRIKDGAFRPGRRYRLLGMTVHAQ